ncbi:DNA mismatch repair protein MutT, partial [Klebsiella pneumoniae]
MLITAVGTPGSGQTHAFRVRHGMNPHVELWRHGLVVREYLSADRVDDEIVVTAHVAPRTSSSQPPRTRKSVPDLSEDRQ